MEQFKKTFLPSTKANPVTLEPGSILSPRGMGVASTAFLRTMVNGYRLNTGLFRYSAVIVQLPVCKDLKVFCGHLEQKRN